MTDDEIVMVIDGEKLIPVKIGKKKTIDEMKQELYQKIELINERKERAALDYTRAQLEKAAKMCSDIQFEIQHSKPIGDFLK